jgi:hypothetical protein
MDAAVTDAAKHGPEAAVPTASAPQFDLDRFLAAKVPGCDVMHFIQGKKRAVLDFLPEFPEDASVLAVVYDDDLEAAEQAAFAGAVPGCREAVFWPGSTWAQGRNFAAEIARRSAEAFAYTAFLDDDVVFTRGTYREFIDQVRRHRPMIAAPVTPRSNQKRYVLPTRLQAAALNDEQLLVFHVSALHDPYVWPIVREHENVSWHVACSIQQFFIANRFPKQLIQFNDFTVSNDGHVWKKDTAGSIYNYEKDFAVVIDTAYKYVSLRLGRAPNHDNEVFRRVRTYNPLTLLQVAHWKYLGRNSWMAGPLNRDGRPLEAETAKDGR